MWRKVFSLVVKEFLAVWQDKRSRTVLIIPPIVQLFVFSFAATLDVNNAKIGVYNRDNGKYSYELLQRFTGSPTFEKVIYFNNEKEVADAIDNQKVLLVVNFDEQFSRHIAAKQTAEVQVIMDGRKSNSAQIVQGYVFQIVEQYTKELKQELNLPKQKTILVTRNWFNHNLIYTWFTVSGLVGVLTMLITLLVTSLSVAREREMGTFEQLLVSPLLPFEILLGKTIPAMIIGMVEGSIILFAGIIFFQIPFTGSFIYLYLSMFVFVCSIVGIGLFISSLSKTQQQALLGVFVFMAPAVALSGFATPIENMPFWLQKFTLTNPLRHFLVVARGEFLKDMSLKLVMLNTYPMAIIAFFTLIGADWMFRRKLE